MIKEISRERIMRDILWVAIDVSKPFFADLEALASCDGATGSPSALALFRRHEGAFDVTEMCCARLEGCYGFYRELLAEMISMAKNRDIPVSLRFFNDRPDYETLRRAADSVGFKRLPGLYLATSYSDAEGLGRRWEAFKERRKRFFERLTAKGYRNIPLTEINASDRAALFAHIKREYNYDPEAAARLTPADEENCLFTFRASRLAAFCFVLRPSPTQMVFDFGGVSPDEKNSGAFLMPLSEYITRTYGYPTAQTIVYLFHENNVEMLNMANRTLSIIIDSTRYKANYFYPSSNVRPFGDRGHG